MNFRENRIESEKKDLVTRLKITKNNLDTLLNKLELVKGVCERNIKNEEAHCVKNQLLLSVRNAKRTIFDLTEGLTGYAAQ